MEGYSGAWAAEATTMFRLGGRKSWSPLLGESHPEFHSSQTYKIRENNLFLPATTTPTKINRQTKKQDAIKER